MVGITNVYQNVSKATSTPDQGPSSLSEEKKGKSFTDLLITDPAKSALGAAKNAEEAMLLSTTGEVDELEVAQAVTAMDVELQKFKSIWEGMIKTANELPRISL